MQRDSIRVLRDHIIVFETRVRMFVDKGMLLTPDWELLKRPITLSYESLLEDDLRLATWALEHARETLKKKFGLIA